jgi:hypothetical protein
MNKPKIVLTKSGGQITGVYLDSTLVGDVEIEVLDYDHDLSEHDESVENQIDSQQLVNVH